MERGGNPHPDEVVPPTVEEGLEFYDDLNALGEHPPLKALGQLTVYWTEWGKVTIDEPEDDREHLAKVYNDIINLYR